MAITRISTGAGGDCATAIKDRIDGGSGPGVIKCYAGSMPDSPDDAITSQTLLGTLTLSDPCGSVSGKTLTFSAITQDSAADASGSIVFCRVEDSAGNAVIDGDASVTAGSGMFKFNTTTVVAGGPIAMTSGTITVG